MWKSSVITRCQCCPNNVYRQRSATEETKERYLSIRKFRLLDIYENFAVFYLWDFLLLYKRLLILNYCITLAANANWSSYEQSVRISEFICGIIRLLNLWWTVAYFRFFICLHHFIASQMFKEVDRPADWSRELAHSPAWPWSPLKTPYIVSPASLHLRLGAAHIDRRRTVTYFKQDLAGAAYRMTASCFFCTFFAIDAGDASLLSCGCRRSRLAYRDPPEQSRRGLWWP